MVRIMRARAQVGIAGQQLFDPREGDQKFLAEHRKPLAQGGRLRRHIVGAARDHQVAVGLGLGAHHARAPALDSVLGQLQVLFDMLLVFRVQAAGHKGLVR